MGGGDLNLKKSRDPRRHDNQEKKWKLEELDKEQRQRMKDLLEEQHGERSVEEMERKGEETGVIQKRKDQIDWMYKGPESHTNPDDYLLGKEVDKAIMKAQHGEQTTGTHGGIASAGAVFASSSASTSIDAKDMARKMREDPLFAIKKRELNNRKELVSNPIRMKQLQLMLQTQVGKDKKKSKKGKKHKEKKRTKHKKLHAASSDTSSEEDDAPRASKRRHLHQQTSPERRRGRGHHRDEDRQRESLNRSGEDEKKAMSSLDPAKMKKLLEREMLMKKHRDVSESSSSETDSDERSATKQRRQDKSGHHSRGQHAEEESKQKHTSHENDSRKRRKGRSVSPEVGKRKHGAGGETIPTKYGLQSGARRLRRSQSQSPERESNKQSRRHCSENKDRHPHDVSPHGDVGKYAEKSQDRRTDNRSPAHKRDKHGDRYGDGRGEKRSRRERSRSKSRSRTPLRDRGEIRDRIRRSRSRSPQRQNGSQRNVAVKRKLTAEEMEKKRAEMMDNAKWRDDQRKERVKVYEKEEQAELEMEKKKDKNAKFVQPLKLPDNSSVEDRIHRNINSIQRTKAALDKNFAKR